MPTGAIEISRIRSALADRYQIEHVLGEGGMATVYQAEDLKHRRKVAVKVMRPELAETLGAERFLREVEIAAKLSHPHILPVYDSGAADGVLYYVMPVVEGESLPARLAREKQLPVEEALRLAREVAEALAYAHERGFVHRDIKPANILISAGHALVADFGIARVMSSDGKALTQTGLAIGTPQYMSPEQASGSADLDGRSDIYALGCVLYEMIAGEPPFTGPTAQAVIARSITETPRSLTSTRQALSPAVDTAVMKALAKTPADRYATAGAMVTALVAAENQTRSGITPVAGSTGGARGGFKPWQLALAAAAVLVIGVFGTRAFSGGGSAAAGVSAGRQSVAVLPFINQGTADDAYFADGIADEVRGKLAKLGQFTVIASASANQYRETTKTGPEIAKELRVDQVLMGRVRWAGAAGGPRQVQVIAELVDGQTGATTWQETFDADVTDIFAMQGRIATRVAAALGAALGQADEAEMSARPTDNPVAYELYLKARAITNNSAQSQRIAADYLEQAVALDSTFAEAWAELGSAWASVYTNGTREPVVRRRAGEAIERALELGTGKSFAHRAASRYYSVVERDDALARREINRALAIDPDDAEVLALSGLADFGAEEYGPAFSKLARARELDPRSVRVMTTLVRVLVYLGRVDEAKNAAAELVALAPNETDAVEWVAVAHAADGDLAGAKAAIHEALQRIPATELVTYFAGYNEMAWILDDAEQNLLFRLTPAAFDNDRAWWGQALAIAAYQQGDRPRARAYADSSLATSKEQSDANPDDPQLRALYAVMLAYVGRIDEALREVDIAVENSPVGNAADAPYARLQRLRILLVAGQTDKAIDAVEDLLTRQYYLTPSYLKLDPTYTPLKGNPRFERLLTAPVQRAVD
jgi:serine/threonine-protein kinase